jgi:hypothetical protein
MEVFKAGWDDLRCVAGIAAPSGGRISTIVIEGGDVVPVASSVTAA